MNNLETSHIFERPKRKKLFGLRRSALAEMIIAVVVLVVLDFMAFDRTRYWEVNPHPFWFIVLLISCKYGTKEGAASAVLCSIAFLLGNIPEQQADQDSYAYILHILKFPLLWMVSSAMFGEMRQMHIRERDALETALTESEEREQQIAQSYEWVKQLKDLLELRMAGQLRSSIAAYRAAKSMESLSPTEVMSGLEELVKSTLNPQQFSVYTLDNKGLSVSLTHGWSDDDRYNRSFNPSSTMYKTVIGEQRVLCVANAEHEQLLDGQAILVGPLLDRDSGEVVGMLKIESLGFTDLHLSNIEAFSTICDWAGMAIVNARKYQAVKADSIVNAEHNLLSSNYFKRFHGFIASLAQRVGFDVSMVTIRLNNADGFDIKTRSHIARTLSNSVDSVLRNVDLAFDHQERTDEYSIVLPATDSKGAAIVIEKIETQLARQLPQVSSNAEFTFSTQMIYDKSAKK